MERRLAADVVGYSRQMGADEVGTMARLRAPRAEVREPLLAEDRGRLFKTTGDGLLAEFAATVQAMICAMAIQQHRRETPDALQIRIGLHNGDLLVAGEDLFGDGVNIAARIEQLAESGGIAMSARVRITCQLIEAATGHHAWAGRFEGKMADIFDLQDRITRSVVGAIEPSLKQAGIARVSAKPTEHLDAYDLYWHAPQSVYARGKDGYDAAVSLLQRSPAIDPKFHRARAYLAGVHSERVIQGYLQTRGPVLPVPDGSAAGGAFGTTELRAPVEVPAGVWFPAEAGIETTVSPDRFHITLSLLILPRDTNAGDLDELGERDTYVQFFFTGQT